MRVKKDAVDQYGGEVRVIGAPAESMKEFGARLLLPKMVAKLKAEVKDMKSQLAAVAKEGAQ